MNGEITTRIPRDELQRSLDVSAATTPRPSRPFAQIAAMLPKCTPVRRHRITTPPPRIMHTTPPSYALAAPERKAPKTVAELRARQERGEQFPVEPSVLANQIVARISDEEREWPTVDDDDIIAELDQAIPIRAPVRAVVPADVARLVASFAAVILGVLSLAYVMT